jgi:MOSC domain-containing protein YiiM
MITAILTSPATGQPQTSQESVEAVAGKGLADDRYATGKGYYTGDAEWDAHVTLIAQEPFDQAAADHGVNVSPAELRRNLITRGVDLYTLVGKRFRVGDQVVLRGRKPWPPCNHIAKLTGKPEILKHFLKHSGIGADVVVGGTIRVGDKITVEEDVPHA